MDFNLNPFKEPRGVMRILHFIFSICAFATLADYSGFIKYDCNGQTSERSIEYPFNLRIDKINNYTDCSIYADFSSDAKFFVATGVLAMLYSIFITVFYLKFDDLYKSNNLIPLIDFVITVIFGVLWLSSSAAWANGLSGLKTVTSLKCACAVTTSSFSSLNISVVLGFLNFFLWASDLWFLYKETAWFQGNQQQANANN